MSGALVLAVKQCVTCGEEKALDEFHRNRRRPDGRQVKCKLCMNAASREYLAKMRERMGEDYFREHQAKIVAKHRERTGNERGKRYLAARGVAIKALIEAHPTEFKGLFDRAKYEAGL